MLSKASNHPPIFRTKNWVEINYNSRETYDSNNQIRFKTSMLKLDLYDNSNAYILISGIIRINRGADSDQDRKEAHAI